MRNWRNGDGEWRLFDYLLCFFVSCPSFRGLLVECNGVAVGFFCLSVRSCSLPLLGWSSCVDLVGLAVWLDDDYDDGVDTAFSACCAEVTCYHESWALHCIQGDRGEKKNRTFQKIKIIKKQKHLTLCTYDLNFIGQD
jgi:hypothetical protein